MSSNHLHEQYALALDHYLADRTETGLHQAYQLGRTALAEGIRSLDIVRMHHEHLSRLLDQSGNGNTACPLALAASLFLGECLSPYEMALTGFREAIKRLETEISERRKIELAVRESEEYFRSLIENSLDIVTILNEDGTIRYDSPSIERVLGYKQGELVGSSVFDLVHPEDRAMIRRTFDSGIRLSLYGDSVEFRVRHKDGNWHVLEGSGRNLLSIPGVRGVLVNSRDVTERKRLQERLDETGRQRAEDLQNFARSIQRVQEEERQRIARELHDDVCQNLSALRLHMNVFEDDIPGDRRASRKRLHGLRKQIDNLIEDVRRISANLRPTALDHFGLVTALRHLVLEFHKTHKLNVSLETNLGARTGCGEQVDITIYRITQEALMNAARHSAAEGVSVVLTSNTSALKLEVRDDGQGFEMEAPGRNRSRGLGLVSMRERAELLGGTFQVQSLPHKGVLVSVEIPLCVDHTHEEDQTPGR